MKSLSIIKIKTMGYQITCVSIFALMSFFISPMISHAQLNETQKNKKLVMNFYTLAFVNKKVEEAINKYVGDIYIQHNPDVQDGKEGVIKFLSNFLNSNPQMVFNVKRVIAEDDLVAIHHHSKMTPEDRGVAIIDIFRVEQGKIVEHWDVIQSVPEKSANDNTMF
jgi:predicted SnoaL-like aldol condensation-catalyzing enzyme